MKYVILKPRLHHDDSVMKDEWIDISREIEDWHAALSIVALSIATFDRSESAYFKDSLSVKANCLPFRLLAPRRHLPDSITDLNSRTPTALYRSTELLIADIEPDATPSAVVATTAAPLPRILADSPAPAEITEPQAGDT
jgi:hypothetical protein